MYRVNPITGERTIVSDLVAGSGTPLVSPVGVAVEPGGAWVVTDFGLDAVVRIDPATGDPTDEDPLAPERLFDNPETWQAAASELRDALFTD